MANGRQPVLGRMLGGRIPAPNQTALDMEADPLQQILQIGRRGTSGDKVAARGPKLQERNLVESERIAATHDVASDFYFTDAGGNSISRTTLEDQGIDTSNIIWDTQKKPSQLREDNQIAITMNGKVVNIDDSTRQPIHNKSGQIVGYYHDYVKPEVYYSDDRKEEILQANYIRDMESLGYGRKQIEQVLAHMKLVGAYNSQTNPHGSRTWAEYTKNLKVRKYNHDELISLMESGFIGQPSIAGAQQHREKMEIATSLKNDAGNWTPAGTTTGDTGGISRRPITSPTWPHETDEAKKGMGTYSYIQMKDNPEPVKIGTGWLDGVDEKVIPIDDMFYISDNIGNQDKMIDEYSIELANQKRLVHSAEGNELFKSGIMAIDRQDNETVRGTPLSVGEILYKHNQANIADTATYDTATADDIIRFLADTELIAYSDLEFKSLSGAAKQSYKLAATAYYHSSVKPEIIAAKEAYKDTYGSNVQAVINHYWDDMNIYAEQRRAALSKLNTVQSNLWNTPSGQDLLERANDVEIFTDKFLRDTEGKISLNHVMTSLAGKTYQEKIHELKTWETQGWLTPQGIDLGYRIINYQEEQTSELRNQIQDWNSLLDIKEVPKRANNEGYRPGLTWLPWDTEHSGTLVQGMEFNPNTNEWVDKHGILDRGDRRLQISLLDIMSQDYTRNKIKFVDSRGATTVTETQYVKQLLKKNPEDIKRFYPDTLRNWTTRDILAMTDRLLAMEDDDIEDNLYRLKQVKAVPYKENEVVYKDKDIYETSFLQGPLATWKKDLKEKGTEHILRHGSPLIKEQ